MYEHNALGYWSGLAFCLTKVRSSRARCPATALIMHLFQEGYVSTAHVKNTILKFIKIKFNSSCNCELR